VDPQPAGTRLDHVFVFVDGPTAARAAEAAGLVPTHRRVHHRQGTANACFRFGPVFLELLWVHDAAELRSEAVARTGLWARSQWRSRGTCPFGVCLRGQPAFPTWAYTVPFPAGISVQMAQTSSRADEPLVFTFPATEAKQPPSVQPLGCSITTVELAYPVAGPPSDAVQAVQAVQAGMVTVRDAPEPHLTLTVDEGVRGRSFEVPEALLTVTY